MNRFKKDIIIIVILSLLLSFVRYMLINDDYSLIKRNRLTGDMSTLGINTDLYDLDILLSSIDSPIVVSLELAFEIHKNNLATFVDARSFDEYNEIRIRP